NATDGSNWSNNRAWLVGPVAAWIGVTVIDDRVAELDLSGRWLSGILPPEIEDLDALTSNVLGSSAFSLRGLWHRLSS
ncbi:MAG: hypothetical protein V3W22_07600, partial [Thermoplasmata archaeon]